MIDSDGSLAIAKFPHHGDEYNIELWSCVALELARKAGINVPPHRITSVLDQQVLIVTRFDRHSGTRNPFLSAMSMISAGDNEPHSYLELVEAIRQHDDQDNSASFDVVLKVGDYFGLENDQLKMIAGEVAGAVSTWRDEAKRLGISSEEINRMATAFEHDELTRALKYSDTSSGT